MVCGLGMPTRAREGHRAFSLGLHPSQHPLSQLFLAVACPLKMADWDTDFLTSYFPEEAMHFSPLINF